MAEFTNLLGIVCSIIYLWIIPESPRWMFLKKGGNCQEAIKNLNYIAWFNGSSYRIPENAVCDLSDGKMVDGSVSASMSKKVPEEEEEKKESIFSELCQLYCGKGERKHKVTHNLLTCLWISGV